jgi:hypothetical protein
MLPPPLPSVTSLAADIRKVMSKGVNRPLRAGATTDDLELVAKEIVANPMLLSIGLCSAAIEMVVYRLGDSPNTEAIATMFGISDVGRPLTKLEDRATRAAEQKEGNAQTVEKAELSKMCRLVAENMLKIAAEGRAASAPPPPAPDSVPRHWLWRWSIAALGVVAVLGGVGFLFADGGSSGGTSTDPLLAQLGHEAERQLTGRRAPAPDKQMTSVLGFGDPTPSGRSTFRDSKRGFTAPGKPTFDALVNANGHVGDERHFVRVETSLTTDSQQLWQLPDKQVAQAHPHEIIWVLVYVDNNAAPTPRCALSGPYVATDTRLRVAVWNSTDDHLHVIRAWLSATNTQPAWITDAVAVLTPNATTLEPDSSISRELSKLSPQFRSEPTINVESLLVYPGMLVGGNGLVGSCWNDRYYLALGFRQT